MQDVQADGAIVVYCIERRVRWFGGRREVVRGKGVGVGTIWMIHLGQEKDFRRFHRVILGEVDGQV